MNIVLTWAGSLVAVFCLAAWGERSALRSNIGGANGFVILMLGVLGLMTLPVGFGLLCYFSDWARAVRLTAAVAAIISLVWWGLIWLLNRESEAKLRR